MLRKVAVITVEPTAVFELGVLCELFGVDRTDDGLPAYEFSVCSVGGRPVRTQAGFTISPGSDLAPAEEADLVAIVPNNIAGVPAEALGVLRRAAARGAWVMGVCTGAFALAQAGLLDGRRCTTHWRHADRLIAEYPAAVVDPDVLYVVDGTILTSAGTSAAVDCGLNLIRQEQGAEVARKIARRMVVPPHRDGGQAQFIETPVQAVDCSTLQPLLNEVMESLDREHTVESMAARVHMAPRTFARKFRAETGATPHDWLTGQRVLLARRLLEETGLGIDAVAMRAGFGSAATLRHHFGLRLGTTPQAYRATFRDRYATSAAS
ncbi:GlxA family transcriptional regulator [Actinoplanes sp. N902-109]|uniref:GlxA family transcriptional regulator n=1 Tax=Actinoplanes sp. (strain N902-109) TaxID=649831 RepID=UPI0003294967|nr:helix-turn-helix domain-containing protein [Actinoplanes sp. N902-109]AGL17846.1 AraC family transcriptional regulator [Actinoplanes sp. N902-109]